MNRAYRFDSLDGLKDLRIHDEPLPVPQRGEVLLRVRAIALNYRDLAPALGRYVWASRPGLIPCSDAAGEIVAIGEGVSAWAEGDRVMSVFNPRWFGGRPHASIGSETYGSAVDGWLCEYKLVSQEALVAMPPTMSFEAAATLPCAATTAWTALSGANAMRAGHTILTQGSGGVSIFTLQLAKAMGCTVIATTSSEAKAARLTGLGADAVVNYRNMPDWGAHVKQALTYGTGVDCVVEVGGPATINQSLTAVRWGGEVVLVGFLSSDNPGIDYFHLKGSGALVRPVGVGDRAAQQDLVRAIAGAGIAPVIDRVFSFDEAIGAFTHLKDGDHIGKIVIRTDG